MFSDANNVKKRVDFLLSSRPAYQVAERYSFNKNWVSLLKNGQGRSVLMPFSLAENVNSDWLLFGLGNPYRVYHWQDTDSMKAAIDKYLGRSGSITACLVDDGVVLWQYQEFQDGDDIENSVIFYSYEAHFGPIDNDIAEKLSQIRVEIADLDDETLLQLKNGQIGTYRLFGYPMEDVIGPLHERNNLPTLKKNQLHEIVNLQETKGDYSVEPSNPLIGEIIDILGELSDSQLSAVLYFAGFVSARPELTNQDLRKLIK